MTIKEKITLLFAESNEWTVHELTEKLGASKQMVHIALKQLLDNGELQKLGRTPKTVYRIVPALSSSQKKPAPTIFTEEDQAYLQDHWLQVTSTGDLLEGVEAFNYWCNQRKEPVLKTFTEYKSTRNKYDAYYQLDGSINGMEKLLNTKGYEHIWLDELHYLDFYAIERFGKTKLGTLLHYAKQGQSLPLMRRMISTIDRRIREFIQLHNVDAVGFIPPTVRREVQLMKVLASQLKLPLPVVDIKKMSGIIPVPQKSLSKLQERIDNASGSFAVTEKRTFAHVLLIDDAVGSGSTLNQVAEKLKNKQTAKKVSGLAIVGSFKGFDVITDV
ncbi:MAG: phosphoribosyltransferase family protein [Sediminibacterium sp.]|nr:phosphoribosyltransferase family protein [Sediminibacterium sp.]